MAYDYSKLRGRIVEMYGTQRDFANALGLGITSLNHSLNSKREFSQGEINKAIELLNLDKTDISAYFFTEKV